MDGTTRSCIPYNRILYMPSDAIDASLNANFSVSKSLLRRIINDKLLRLFLAIAFAIVIAIALLRTGLALHDFLPDDLDQLLTDSFAALDLRHPVLEEFNIMEHSR